MIGTRILRLDEIAAGGDFHAAFVTLQRSGVAAHTHDFGEMLYVLAGAGTHEVNGAACALAEGDLLLIRPADTHAIRPAEGEALHFINIAFAVPAWSEFIRCSGLTETAGAWESTPLPPCARVPPDHAKSVADTFRRALRAFHESPSRLELCRFWLGALAPLLARPAEPPDPGDAPAWLRDARRAMRDPGNLRHGVPRLVELSGVSAAHLSRTLRSRYGQSPTEFVNGLRLDRAATLLATTPLEIIAVAADCGFENLSYFYRLFARKYGQTPRAYRLQARRRIAPEDSPA